MVQHNKDMSIPNIEATFGVQPIFDYTQNYLRLCIPKYGGPAQTPDGKVFEQHRWVEEMRSWILGTVDETVDIEKVEQLYILLLNWSKLKAHLRWRSNEGKSNDGTGLYSLLLMRDELRELEAWVSCEWLGGSTLHRLVDTLQREIQDTVEASEKRLYPFNY